MEEVPKIMGKTSIDKNDEIAAMTKRKVRPKCEMCGRFLCLCECGKYFCGKCDGGIVKDNCCPTCEGQVEGEIW
jgi:hypothetical protein